MVASSILCGITSTLATQAAEGVPHIVLPDQQFWQSSEVMFATLLPFAALEDADITALDKTVQLVVPVDVTDTDGAFTLTAPRRVARDKAAEEFGLNRRLARELSVEDIRALWAHLRRQDDHVPDASPEADLTLTGRIKNLARAAVGAIDPVLTATLRRTTGSLRGTGGGDTAGRRPSGGIRAAVGARLREMFTGASAKDLHGRRNGRVAGGDTPESSTPQRGSGSRSRSRSTSIEMASFVNVNPMVPTGRPRGGGTQDVIAVTPVSSTPRRSSSVEMASFVNVDTVWHKARRRSSDSSESSSCPPTPSQSRSLSDTTDTQHRSRTLSDSTGRLNSGHRLSDPIQVPTSGPGSLSDGQRPTSEGAATPEADPTGIPTAGSLPGVQRPVSEGVAASEAGVVANALAGPGPEPSAPVDSPRREPPPATPTHPQGRRASAPSNPRAVEGSRSLAAMPPSTWPRSTPAIGSGSADGPLDAEVVGTNAALPSLGPPPP
jgi:hypothetical protein